MSKKHTVDTKDGTETRILTKAKAIRLKCLDCCGWVSTDVKKCTCHTCSLYPFRFGNEKGLETMYYPEDFDANGNIIGEEPCSLKDCKNYDSEAEDDQFCSSCISEGKDKSDEEDDEELDWDDDDE